MKNPKKVFSQIYDKYVDKIYRFIFLKVNSQEIAEDLCSETFLKGWQAFKGNPQKIENPPAFLYQIARNLVIDHYRQKDRTQFVSTDSVPIIDPRTDLEEKSLLGSDLEIIKTALTNINQDYQEVIIWHYIDDLSINEIAKMLNKSEGAVRVRLHRALKALRKTVNSIKLS